VFGKPEFFTRYKQLGHEIGPVMLSPCIRVNSLKISHAALLQRLGKEGVVLEKANARDAFIVKRSKFSLGACVEHLLGYFYVQSLAAQLPVQVLNPLPSDRVLDCCAAPGGKTTQLCQWMNNRGVIVALEKKDIRFPALRNALNRFSTRNVVAFKMDCYNVKQLGMKYDKVLLDAPCSGNYASDPDWFEKRTLKDVRHSARIQKDLLAAAIKATRNGGIVVYSTCSLEPEENELNIQWALDNFRVKILPTGLTSGDPGLTKVFTKTLSKDMSLCRRFWPGKYGTEGFFVARLKC